MRALNWGTRPSDILLHPHSPLALADVLLVEGGCFDLVASDTQANDTAREQNAAGTEPEATPTAAARRRKRRTRERMNLLTLHTRTELQKRCRALTVENALVKQKHEQHLFLAAGFIEAKGMRAPVLLYPALLIHKPGNTGHEIRLTSGRPDLNHKALAVFNERFGIDLQKPTSTEPLSDYFAQLAAAITPVAGLDFSFEVALGNAAPKSFTTRRLTSETLPDVPDRFDFALALSLASDVSLDELHTVLDLIPEVSRDDAKPDAGTSANTTLAQDEITQLRTLSVNLATRGLDKIAFQQLPELADQINSWVNHITIGRKSAIVTELFSSLRLNTTQLARLANVMELLDKAPVDFESPMQANLAYSSTGTILRRAQHQAQLIEEEFEIMQHHFVMELIPTKTELLQLIDELDRPSPKPLPEVQEALSDVVDADYFHARRRFMDFSRERPAHIEQEHTLRLKQLAKVLRFRELFVNNTEYRQSLGTSYRGLSTDWAQLTAAVEFARELSEALGSEAMAAIAIADLPHFRRSLIADLDALQASNDALRAALTVFGRDWVSRSVEEFVNHLEQTASSLHEWRLSFDHLMADNTWTPAVVLARFTGKSALDKATERRVQAARAHIADTLGSDHSDLEAVAGTLDWLRMASRHAAESQLDIDAIVDHLQIA